MRCGWTVIVLVTVGASMVGCAQQGSAGVSQDRRSEPDRYPVSTSVSATSVSTTVPSGSGNADSDRIEAAQAVLAAWDTVLAAAPADTLVTAGETLFPAGLTRTSGDWPQVDGAGVLGTAAAAGALEYLSTSVDAPSPAVVELFDGRTATVPVVDAETAVAAARADGNGQDCAGCLITLVAPVFGTTQLVTADGAVSVPAWDFTVAGTSLHLMRVAVDPDHLLTRDDLPDLSEFARSGAGSEVAAARVTGPTSISVDIYRSNPACGAQLEVTPVESAHTFTVLVTDVYPTVTTCDARAYSATAEIQLAAPIGDRTLIDMALGGPVVLER